MGAAQSKALYDAAVLGRTEEVLELLKRKTSPNWAGMDGHTALMKASQAGSVLIPWISHNGFLARYSSFIIPRAVTNSGGSSTAALTLRTNALLCCLVINPFPNSIEEILR